ncbi:MAG: hypothetical protein GX351_04515, partial [Peptococcaceae bacterium]|nr:hypothetical protein [Peptococcaceae bacterium]
MKLLALFVAFFILLFIIFFLRIYLELSYSFRNYESKLNLEIRILFLKFKINFNIPKELLVKGYNNIVQNFINDLSEHEEQIKSDPETTNSVNAKSRRYRTLKFSMRESFRHYMASWL